MVKLKSHPEVRRVCPAVLVNTVIIALNVLLDDTDLAMLKMPRNALNVRLDSIKTVWVVLLAFPAFRECVVVVVAAAAVVVLVVALQSTHFILLFVSPTTLIT